MCHGAFWACIYSLYATVALLAGRAGAVLWAALGVIQECRLAHSTDQRQRLFVDRHHGAE